MAAAAEGAFEAAAQAAAVAAAVNGTRAASLRCFHAQDQPWMQQLWYIYDAVQVFNSSSSSSRSATDGQPGPPTACIPVRPGCKQCSDGGAQPQQQQQQQWHPGSSSSGGSSGACSSRCSCSAVCEVVSRPPDTSGRQTDININKNLLLLLHHAGVPLEVFER
jgi:hypothetical protein